MPDRHQIGVTLRRVRLERDLSLADVAGKAGISVATLSRVETDKQNVDVTLLLTLAEVLDVPGSELLGGDGDGDDPNVLARKLGRLRPSERTKVFLQSSGRRDAKALAAVVDDLLTTVEVLRDELLHVQRAVRSRSRK
jgi:transcriptional regulator with XRE-family HTH domain